MRYQPGVARVTYPKGIVQSGAGAVTSVAVPAALERVPGGISRPIRIGDLADNGDEWDARQLLADTARVTADINRYGQQITRDVLGYPPAPGYGYPTTSQYPRQYDTGTWLPWLLLGGGFLVVMSMMQKGHR